MSWRWLDKQALLLLHGESVAEHGGAVGVRDAGLLDSALARAQNLAAYGDPDVAALAAAYGSGISQNHPFVDGNKRAAFLSVGLFLALNGYRLVVISSDARARPDQHASAAFHAATRGSMKRRHSGGNSASSTSEA